MKSLILSLTLLAGLNVHASTVDSYVLPITGAKTEENLSLKAIQTRTEYRDEVVEKTCYRTVVDGYDRICRQEPRQQCYEDRESRRICRTVYDTRCYDQVRYRTEAYACYETRRVGYEVYNNDAQANLKVLVSNVPGLEIQNSSCGIEFTLTGNDLKTLGRCAEFIIYSNVKLADESRVGSTVIQSRVLDVTLLDAKKVSAPTREGIKEMRLEGQTLVLRTGDLTQNPNFSLKLFVEKRHLFKKDETLIKRNLSPAEYSFTKTDDNSGLVRIDLKKLVGGIDVKKKHVLKVNLDVVLDTKNVINSSLPNLSAEKSITVNE